jgi:hypothetical protein
VGRPTAHSHQPPGRAGQPTGSINRKPDIKFNLGLNTQSERQTAVKSMPCGFDGSLCLVPRNEYLARGLLRSGTANLPDAIGASREVALLRSEVAF